MGTPIITKTTPIILEKEDCQLGGYFLFKTKPQIKSIETIGGTRYNVRFIDSSNGINLR
jgi:hypothetical protein